MSPSSILASPIAKLGAYAAVLAAALGGGALVGAAVGPAPSATPPSHDAHAAPDAPSSAADPDHDDVPGGVLVASDGFTLQLETSAIPAGTPGEVAFTVTGPDGSPVTAFDVEHERELHLVVVGRDLGTYAHVHPQRDAAGRWTAQLPALAPGSYRAFADFTATGHDGVVLGADLTAPGDVAAPAPPPPATTATVDGFDVELDGTLVAGEAATVTVTVTRDGEPVTDLRPYLGALGHLVAIRDGDLAYLHVHPLEEATASGGPSVAFAVEVPSAGRYGLFFDFAHGGDVRTAAFVLDAAES
jgi:hypothetical protein